MITHRQLEEAKEFIDYGIKEGLINEKDFEDLSDEQFVIEANRLKDKGDMYADQRKDE